MKKIRQSKKHVSLLLTLLAAGLLFAGAFSTACAAEYQKISDLNGKKIGVQTGCLYETHIADECPDAEIQYFTMPQDMILALNSKKIDAYLIEEVGYYATAAAHPELAVLPESAGLCEAAVIIGNNEKQEKLLAQMNEFIAKHGSNGDGMLDEMYDYWVKDFDAETSKTEQGGFTGENGLSPARAATSLFRMSTRRATAVTTWTLCTGSAGSTATHRTSSALPLNPSRPARNPANMTSV